MKTRQTPIANPNMSMAAMADRQAGVSSGGFQKTFDHNSRTGAGVGIVCVLLMYLLKAFAFLSLRHRSGVVKTCFSNCCRSRSESVSRT